MLTTATSHVTDLEADVLSRISEERWLTLATELIRTGQPRSGNPLDPDLPPAEEEAISMLVAGKLEAMGMTVSKYSVAAASPERCWRVERPRRRAVFDHQRSSRHLSRCGAAQVAHDRLRSIQGDPARRSLYARGTSDTRGNIAASLLAVQALVESGVTFDGDLDLLLLPSTKSVTVPKARSICWRRSV